MPVNQLSIIEPLCGGHHGTYLSWLVQGALESGFNPEIVTTQKCIDSEDFRLNIDSFINCRTVGALDLSPDKIPKLIGQFVVRQRAARWLARAIDSIGQDSEVLLPYLDMFTYQIATNYRLLSSHAWSGISMSAKFHHSECLLNKNPSQRDKLEKYLFVRLLLHPKLRSVFCLDPLLPDYLSRSHPNVVTKLIYLPDPANTHQIHSKIVARQKLGIPADRFMILCYGNLDPRKGLRELAEATMQPLFPANTIVVLAGVVTKATRDLMGSGMFAASLHSKKIIVDDRFMTHDEESVLFSAADLTWLGYTNFYQMSGVFARSLAYEVPVLGTTAGLIGWHIKHTGAGFTLSNISPIEIAETISRLSQDSTLMETARFKTLTAKQLFSTANAKDIVFKQ